MTGNTWRDTRMPPYALGSHYHQLTAAIAGGNLEISMLVAPPRTGSTATAMWLSQGRVDGHFIEPGARCSFPASRLEDTFRDIHEYYLGRLASAARPIKLTIKEISQHIGPGQEASMFFALASRVLMLIRNPLLALESHLLLTAALVGKLQRDPQDIEQLRRWLVPHASVSHIDPCNPAPVWEQHWRRMRAKRDYSSLNHRIWLATNDMFTSRSLQFDVWENQRKRLTDPDQVARTYGYRDWLQMTEANYCASLDQLCSHYVTPDIPTERSKGIPQLLSDCFAYRQGGWDATAEHYRTLRDNPNFAGVVDFTTLQLFPDRCAPDLLRALGIETARQKQPTAFWSGYGQGPASNLEETLFGDTSRTDIQPPRHSPIVPERWPRFLRQHLPTAIGIYVQLSAQAHRPDRAGLTTEEILLTPVTGQPEHTIAQIDPTYAYCMIKSAPDRSLPQIIEATAALRASYPQYVSYFDMMERTCSQDVIEHE
jgi:hypothetical protein